jgi:hypothetical protein
VRAWQVSVSFATQLAGGVTILIATDPSERMATDIIAGGPCTASTPVNASAWTVLFVPCALAAAQSYWLFGFAADASGSGEVSPAARVLVPSVFASMPEVAPYGNGNFTIDAALSIASFGAAKRSDHRLLLQDAGCPVEDALTVLVTGSAAAAATVASTADGCGAACWAALPGVVCAFAPATADSCPIGLRNLTVVPDGAAPSALADVCELFHPLSAATPYVLLSLAATAVDGPVVLAWASVTTPSTLLSSLSSSIALLPRFAPAVSTYYSASLSTAGWRRALPAGT